MVVEREMLDELQYGETFVKNCDELQNPTYSEAEQPFINKYG